MDHYKLLQVSADASPEVIRAAYRALVQRAHPDRAGSDAVHQERMKEINRAYSVLSNPASRAAYDARLSGVGPPLRLPDPMARPVDGAEFSVIWRAGTVLSNEAWSDTQVQSKGGGGFVLGGYGFTSAPRVSSTITPRQRIVLRLAGGDVFIEQSGEHLRVVAGQRIVLFSVTAEKLSDPVRVAIWNLDTREWFLLSDGVGACGSRLCPRRRSLRDFALYAVCLVGSAWLGWHMVYPMSWLVWAFYFVFGVPILIGAFTPVLFWTQSKITYAVRSRVVALIDRLNTTDELNGSHA